MTGGGRADGEDPREWQLQQNDPEVRGQLQSLLPTLPRRTFLLNK